MAIKAKARRGVPGVGRPPGQLGDVRRRANKGIQRGHASKALRRAFEQSSVRALDWSSNKPVRPASRFKGWGWSPPQHLIESKEDFQLGKEEKMGLVSSVYTSDAKPQKARGRKDKEGQEAIINATILKDRVDDLVLLYKRSEEAGAKYNDAVKAIAEKSGLLASVVNKVVRARSGNDFDEAKRKADQLSLAFEEVGSGVVAKH